MLHRPLLMKVSVPFAPHPGAFGAQRKFDIHTGVDLYCPERSLVSAIEDGTVVAVENFTGESVGSPWWHETQAVLVEGKSGVVVYGEIEPYVEVGSRLHAGYVIGRVMRVLKKDKGLPTSMLHVELHTTGTRSTQPWTYDGERPSSLLNPTQMLMAAK